MLVVEEVLEELVEVLVQELEGEVERVLLQEIEELEEVDMEIQEVMV